MTTTELTRAVFNRLKKYFYVIAIISVGLCVLLILYAQSTPVTLSSRASVFPLNSSPENTTSSALSAFLGGGGDNSKSYSDDAAVSILEVAQSRKIREDVAAAKVPSMGNKTIAELLINDINNHLGLLETKIEMPKNPTHLITLGGNILKGGLTAATNKNNTLILTYTGRTEDLVRIISYSFIENISNYYKELKIEKAKRDFEFATSKVDSLRRVINAKDYQLISMDQRTLFTNTNRLRYKVPAENLVADKQMLRNLYVNALGNQQNAANKLQKATPIIQILDKPEPPYEVQKKSKLLYGLIGFFLGAILSIGLLISGLILKFIREETSKAIFGSGTSKTTTTTATAL